ncbi:MAG: hypothetical protein J6A09_03885 [Alphaproteobacteria bacterium]|nr:hypothetical protein [Alphaproteobacteria bacterium]
MKLSTLYKLTYIYLALPLFLFIISWLNFGFATLYALLCGGAFYFAYPREVYEERENFGQKSLVLMAGAAILWCFFAGIGYFYYQSFDYHFRNAVFRDLINYDWPVFYPLANTPLVYYMAFWLIPASVAKFFSLFTADRHLLFMLGNYVLFCYAVFGVTLIFAHLAQALKVRGKKQILMAMVLFILFSGLDIIGYRFFRIVEQPFDYHLEWWATFIQYSSFTTGMFWVFNQFIPIALITLLVYNERKICNFGFIIALCLFFSPYPTAGVGVFMMAYAGGGFVKSADKKKFLQEDIFSVQNIIGVFGLLPLLVLYFITNSEGMDGWHNVFDFATPKRLILFMVLEFLLYVLLLFRQYRKNIFFMTASVLLVLIPFFRLDWQNNFCMRASIPALIIHAVFVMRFLFEQRHSQPVKTALLGILLAIGAVTPLTEFYRGIHFVAEAKKLNVVKDEIYTLNGAFIPMPEFGFDVNHQYTAKKYKTDIFWQYFSKKLPR